MGFFKSVVKVIATPVTVLPKVWSNVGNAVIKKTGLDNVPIVGNVANAATTLLAAPDEFRRNGTLSKESAGEVGKAALVAGAAVATGGAGAALVGATQYGGASFFSKNPGMASALETGLGIPPGTLEQFLPTSSPTNYGAGADPVPEEPKIVYGTGSSSGSSMMPVILIGGLGAAALFLAMRKKR